MNVEYTVILIYPDYIASNYGEEFWFAHVVAPSVSDAVHQARAEVFAANFGHLDQPPEDVGLEDFAVVAVFSGHHDDVSYLLEDDE